MAKQTFKNPTDGPVRFTFANGGDPVRVGAGESVSTDREEVKTALRKAGFVKGDSKKEKK